MIYSQVIQAFFVVVFGSDCCSLVYLWGIFVMFNNPEILYSDAVFIRSFLFPFT